MGAKPHFRILGIPVRIEPFFWIGAVFLGYQLGDARLIIMWVGVVLVSLLVHELGHAIALKIAGQSSSIVLHGFGGLTFSQRRLGKLGSILVSLAGPLTALCLLGIPMRLLRDSDTGLELFLDYRSAGNVFGLWPIVFFAAYVNIWWSLLNLLPIRPLDGGNVMTELIGIRTARLVSVVVAAGAAVWAYTNTVDFQFAAFFFGFLAIINLSEHTKARQGARGPSAFDVDAPAVDGKAGHQPGRAGPTPAGPGGPGRASAPRRRGGWPTGPPSGPSRTNVPPMAPAGTPSQSVDAATAESAIWNLLRRGDVPGARRMLARSASPVGAFAAASVEAASGGSLDPLGDAYLAAPGGPSNLVPASVAASHPAFPTMVRRLVDAGPAGVEAVTSIQTHLHYAERFEPAARTGEILHPAAGPTRAQVAFDVACSWARAGDADAALGWIRRAIDDGFGAPRLLDGEPDLADVRAHPDWPGVRARLG